MAPLPASGLPPSQHSVPRDAASRLGDPCALDLQSAALASNICQGPGVQFETDQSVDPLLLCARGWGKGDHWPMTSLRMWQRERSAKIIAEVTPFSGVGSWAACVWRLQGDPHRTEAGHHFTLLTDAHTAADQGAEKRRRRRRAEQWSS